MDAGVLVAAATVAGLGVAAAVLVLAAGQQRRLQRHGGGIKGGAGVVDELWRPTEHQARIVAERRAEAGDETPLPGEPAHPVQHERTSDTPAP